MLWGISNNLNLSVAKTSPFTGCSLAEMQSPFVYIAAAVEWWQNTSLISGLIAKIFPCQSFTPKAMGEKAQVQKSSSYSLKDADSEPANQFILFHHCFLLE